MLSKQITRLRKNAGMSQSELAKELHVSASAAGMYEQGRRIPNLDIIVLMAQIFDVSLDYLITGSEHNRKNSASVVQDLREDCPCSTCYWKRYDKT